MTKLNEILNTKFTFKDWIKSFVIVSLVCIHRYGLCKFLHRWNLEKDYTREEWRKIMNSRQNWESYCPIIDKIIMMLIYPIIKIKDDNFTENPTK